ncbi:MAG: haloacid dehalogenase type II [Pseudomonadota bacterium]
MPAPKLFVFDAYGTLFDVHGPARLLADELGPVADQLSEIWRVKQLEYSWLRGLMGRYVPFSEVTREALAFAFGACGLAENRPLEKRLMQAYQSVPAYADVVPTLDALLGAGCRTAILTNGSKNMIGSAVKNADLENRITAILSVDDVKTFKPHPSVYQMVLDRFAVEPSDVCFITSNGWDAAGAGAFGFRVVWLNRFNRTQETLGPAPNAVLSDMTSLPGLFA